MSGYRIEHCRSLGCEAPIIWAVTSRGKRMPVDAEPSPDGNVELAGPPAAPHVLPHATVYGQRPLDAAERTLRLPHHATCPKADEWRTR